MRLLSSNKSTFSRPSLKVKKALNNIETDTCKHFKQDFSEVWVSLFITVWRFRQIERIAVAVTFYTPQKKTTLLLSQNNHSSHKYDIDFKTVNRDAV